MEILRQCSGKQLTAIFCCVGGGGLLAGVLAYVKQVRPDVKVFGVEAMDAPAMRDSLAAGHRVKLDQVGLFADGAAVSQVGTKLSTCFRTASAMLGGAHAGCTMVWVGGSQAKRHSAL
jgi:threonine dehydratase|eukprot:COSAG01_NODE_11982_length_1823_cov_33.000520_3_plen_118_part_00